jgi:hypothetical protein
MLAALYGSIGSQTIIKLRETQDQIAETNGNRRAPRTWLKRRPCEE